MKNAAQKLAKRAKKRETEIGSAWRQMVEATDMTPAQFAAFTVILYADMHGRGARSLVNALVHPSPSQEVPKTGIVTVVTSRARCVEVMATPPSPEAKILRAILQSSPQEGFFWLLCIAGDEEAAWSLSMVAWSIWGAAAERGHLAPEDALTVWHHIDRTDPGFWDGHPVGQDGPVTDDDRVCMVNAGWQKHEKTGAS